MARIARNLNGETVIRGEYSKGSPFLRVKPTGVKEKAVRSGTFRAYIDTPSIRVRRSKALGRAIRLVKSPIRHWRMGK